MAESDSLPAIAALVFSGDENPDEVLSRFADGLMQNRHRVMGLIQRGHCNGPDTRELFATLLHTGDAVPLFQDLGTCAQGCKLDANQLLRAGAAISEALARDGGDILIVNRFGKLEKEGKGLLFLIEQALGAGIPVLIAVPQASLDEWSAFSGGFDVRLACSERAVSAWWESFSTPAGSLPGRRIA
ncbi:MAG: DUF2478 domain-containing protein [Bradyrhizobiaceae bacterium]|nr:MAG: DUF2478 domain-containing protein [Bradyrhizobiaceae bacterium]